MNIFEKAASAGLDSKQIKKAQLKFDTVHSRTMEIHEALDRVILHAAMYDNPGKNVRIGWLGLGVHLDGATEVVSL